MKAKRLPPEKLADVIAILESAEHSPLKVILLPIFQHITAQDAEIKKLRELLQYMKDNPDAVLVKTNSPDGVTR